jgi:3-oxoacyl-[acyl-carrier-protein] synthase III
MSVVMAEDPTLSGNAQLLMRQLLLVWLEFERRLGRVPIVHRLEQGTITEEDYRRLLFNLRAQVVEGSRWITRAASSFTTDQAELRSTIIGHAYDEHRDYELLESDYVAMGGSREDIRRAPRNIGTEALAGYLMNQASQPNPVDLLGAMFIIEGLGNRMASHWAARIRQTLGVGPDATAFLSYHGQNDAVHLQKLHAIVTSDAVSEESIPRMVKTAKVVARLYALQLEELDQV